MSLTPDTLAMVNAVAAAASDALAEDIVAIDVSDKSPFTDAFLVVTADNPRHLRAVRSNMTDDVRKTTGRSPLRIEGDDTSQWLLIDYGNVVVHVFLAESRQYYSLDKLWNRSPRMDLTQAQATAS